MKYRINNISEFHKIINNRSYSGNILLDTTEGLYPFITQSEFQDISKYISKVLKLEQTWNNNTILTNVNVADIVASIPNFMLNTNIRTPIIFSVNNNNVLIKTDRGGGKIITAILPGISILTITAEETETHDALIIIYNITISNNILEVIEPENVIKQK